ncbi:MAG: hypothetical protein IJE91_01670 [Clostridia bacterium]|nr:hypothetical protein [Clostridia bacterium]
MAVQIVLCVLSILFAALFIVVRVTKGGVLGIATKALASLSFVAYGVFSLTQITWFNEGSAFIIMGLVCGLIGDILLDAKVVYTQDNDAYLNSGMLVFGVGHVFYLVGTILFSHQVIKLLTPILVSVAIAAVLTAVVVLVGKKLGFNFGKFLWQTVAYSFILTFMSAFTIYLACLQPEFLVIAGGLTLFLLSDLVLSLQYFGGKQTDKFCTIVNHSLYYAAQILIATFLFLF